MRILIATQVLLAINSSQHRIWSVFYWRHSSMIKMDFVLDERALVDWMFSCCMKLNEIVPHFSMDCFF